ncbi:MAG: Do family serine endopeptidase [Bacteroidota bacterium]
MKNFGLIILASVISAIVSVSLYRYFEEPREVIIRESAPAMYTNYSDQLPSGLAPRQFLSSSPTNFTSAAEAVTPAVVNIRTTSGDYEFWGGGSYSGSSGSGVIISPDGYIVTNNHVIEDGKNIEVTLNDNRKFTAKLIGSDSSTDLALIKIKEEDGLALPHLMFGNSDSIRVGEWVLAVGNPFNLESTVTAGIVSAKGRSIDILEDMYRVESFIQTDAAVNPGNSGGALVNTNGELVGINTAIITRSGRYEGYSFAIPANLASKVIRDLKDFGMVQRGILGVNIEEVTDELAKDIGLPAVEGVYISRVNPNSGAEDGGIRRGDVIIGINGVKTGTIPQLQEQVARFRPGKSIEVQYIRKGKSYKTDVTLKTRNNNTALVGVRDESILQDLGIELRDLTKSERRKLDVDGGVMVKSIIRGSKIERTNMDPGFIITKVNDANVTNVEEVISELKKTTGKVLLEGVYENYPGEWGYTFSK